MCRNFCRARVGEGREGRRGSAPPDGLCAGCHASMSRVGNVEDGGLGWSGEPSVQARKSETGKRKESGGEGWFEGTESTLAQTSHARCRNPHGIKDGLPKVSINLSVCAGSLSRVVRRVYRQRPSMKKAEIDCAQASRS